MQGFLSRFFLLAAACWLLAACQTAPVKSPQGFTEAQIAVLKEEGFEEVDDGWKYDLSGKVLFATDSAVIEPETVAAIGRLAKVLQDIDIHSMVIEGHTDNQGSAEYNLRLSEQRAAAVADVVIASGFQKERTLVRGLGLSRPIADNATEEGRSENRRVSIIVGSAWSRE